MKKLTQRITHQKFEELFNRAVERCAKVLLKKSKEYASDTDKMHNFNRAAEMLGEPSEKVAFMYAMKHLQSVIDIVYNGKKVNKEVWEEKITDLQNYLFIIDAIMQEKYYSGDSSPEPKD